MVIANYQLRLSQERDEILQFILRLDPVFSGLRTKGTPHGNLHLAEIGSSPDIVEAAFCLQVEINRSAHD